MHAVPRRHRQSAPSDAAEALGRPTFARAVAGDDGRLHLRSGTGRAESGANRFEILSQGNRVMPDNNTALLEIPTVEVSNWKPVSFSLNGSTVVGRSDETILQTAQRHGVEIPRLCYMEGMRPDGNCRTCMVEIKGERVLAPSCCRYPKAGMEVTTNSPRVLTSQKMSLELLLSDVPETAYTLNSELDLWAKKLAIGKPRFSARHQPVEDVSHPAMSVHLDAGIQCNRCVRACREDQVNDVIGYAFRGEHSKIVFDFDDPMGISTWAPWANCSRGA